MNQLFQIILNQLAFHELSDDDSIDPDVAVQQLEQIIYEVCHLDPEILNDFKRYTKMMEDKEENDELKNVYKCTIDSIEMNI
ncbi:hypothetical protein LNTAR_19317 [Lentisphaera araneosa HTCC2155]|uniref:Uncharacterized protein n=1 Tax=Lentisphaera araneosa HTCC2155 TaxID=313628 RepID=A6DQS9_9BACT|nr:hypothetical protein [Lentisphaera araneosa]EDM25979.1 hypothetical protein LNTAR_19317 [Lentisphaera araneosa HTCC2155]